MQCFVIEYFCFWFPFSRSSNWLTGADLVWSCSFERSPDLHMWGQRQGHPHDGRDKKVGAPWQHPTLSPLFTIGQSALTVAGDWSAGTGHTRPGHCLLCVDLWQTPTLIGGILTQLSTPRHWPGGLAGHCRALPRSRNKTWHMIMRTHMTHDTNMRQ